MRIRMKMPIAGTFHNMVEGVVTGQVVDVDDDNAQRYIDLGYAELADQRGKPEPPPKEEHAVASKAKEERAVVEPEVTPEPPVKRSPGRPRTEVEFQPVKRAPGRPRKNP